VRRFIVSIAALAVAAATVAATGPAAATPAAKVIAFVATYSGTASTAAQGGTPTYTISANGKGRATLIGAGTIIGQGTGDTSQQPCVPFLGTGKMVGPTGTVIFKVTPGSSACGDESGTNFTFTAHFVVLKATGKLLKAKGTLKATGVFNHGDGSFSVKVTGKLTK
jgi:hypothetical protein